MLLPGRLCVSGAGPLSLPRRVGNRLSDVSQRNWHPRQVVPIGRWCMNRDGAAGRYSRINAPESQAPTELDSQLRSIDIFRTRHLYYLPISSLCSTVAPKTGVKNGVKPQTQKSPSKLTTCRGLSLVEHETRFELATLTLVTQGPFRRLESTGGQACQMSQMTQFRRHGRLHWVASSSARTDF